MCDIFNNIQAGINSDRLNELESRVAQIELDIENLKADVEANKPPSGIFVSINISLVQDRVSKMIKVTFGPIFFIYTVENKPAPLVQTYYSYFDTMLF